MHGCRPRTVQPRADASRNAVGLSARGGQVGTYAEWYRRETASSGKPVGAALNPAEWADGRYRGPDGEAWVDAGGVLRTQGAFGEEERRSLAALALEGEPLGFTWHDVDFIRATVLADDMHSPEDWFVLQRLGARIAALLPPRDG
jgi:hypothetical protein